MSRSMALASLAGIIRMGPGACAGQKNTYRHELAATDVLVAKLLRQSPFQ